MFRLRKLSSNQKATQNDSPANSEKISYPVYKLPHLQRHQHLRVVASEEKLRSNNLSLHNNKASTSNPLHSLNLGTLAVNHSFRLAIFIGILLALPVILTFLLLRASSTSSSLCWDPPSI